MLGFKRKLSPQEKKVLRYAKDGRNTVAESRSIAHKSIATRKAKANRALRRAETIASAEAAHAPEEADPFVPQGRAEVLAKDSGFPS